MAILNQILQQPFSGSIQPPMMRPFGGLQTPMAPQSAGMNPQDPAHTMMDHQRPDRRDHLDRPHMDFGNLQDLIGQFRSGGVGPGGMPGMGGGVGDQFFGLGGGGAPGMGAAAHPAAVGANPYGSGIMGSVMKAFNGGAGGGLDPTKLMAMLAV